MSARARPAPPDRPTRERILDAACDVIAAHGIDDVRIARIATAAGVSPALVHYHFDTREALLARALEHSFELVGDLRVTDADAAGWTAAERLGWMIDQSLPYPGMGERDWKLWVELWLRTVRQPELRPVAARLYERYQAWFGDAVRDGVAAGEFRAADADAVARRIIGLIDGLGMRVLLGDPQLDLAAARREIIGAAAEALGLPVAALEGSEGGGIA